MSTLLAETGEVLSLTGFRAMDYSDHPLAIVNPAATPRDAVAWACDELGDLQFMLDLVACSSAEHDVDPADLCMRVGLAVGRVLVALKRCRSVMSKPDVQP